MSELSIRVNAGAVAGAFQNGAAAFINSSSFASCNSAVTSDSSVVDGISRYRAGVSGPMSRLKAPMGVEAEPVERGDQGIRQIALEQFCLRTGLQLILAQLIVLASFACSRLGRESLGVKATAAAARDEVRKCRLCKAPPYKAAF